MDCYMNATSDVDQASTQPISFMLLLQSSSSSASSLSLSATTAVVTTIRCRRQSSITCRSLELSLLIMLLIWMDVTQQRVGITTMAWQYAKSSLKNHNKNSNNARSCWNHHGSASFLLSLSFVSYDESKPSRSRYHPSLLSSSFDMRSMSSRHQTLSKPALFLSTKTATSVIASSSSSLYSTFTSHADKQQQTIDDDQVPSLQLIGIDWLQDTVSEVLNELFDYKDIAHGNARTKINKMQQQQNDYKQKKTKKKKGDDHTSTIALPQEESNAVVVLTDEEKDRMIHDAIMNAKPFTRQTCMVSTATKSEFGDYQINVAMTIAQSLKALHNDDITSCTINPISVAQQIVDALTPRIQQYFQTPLEIAGPGFINMKYNTLYVQRGIYAMASSMVSSSNNNNSVPTHEYRLGIPFTKKKQKIIVDYSSPNIAKEMHVGHLRSTIIGDTISNVLQFRGHDVIRLNHVGDWGTQFGMLVEHLRDEYPDALKKETSKAVNLGDLVLLYKAAKKRFDADEQFKQRARDGVVKLQAGNPEEIAAWESLCDASRVEYQKIYDLLNVNKNLIERGESFYNPYLADTVHQLKELGLAVESDGATVIFLDGYTNRDGTPLPIIIQKSDGGYNYATTDLAAIRHRTSIMVDDGGEKADRVLYVTDAGQSQHFDMVFAAAKLANFVPPQVSLEHVPFGLVQGADGKKFATRSGDTVKLKDLLHEAIKIANDDLISRNRLPDFDNSTSQDPEELNRIERVAQIVGVGAVKYADLSMNRESNYKFNYDKMLSLNGNTAPYMLYAYARICGIIRKATNVMNDDTIQWPVPSNEVVISHASEYDLMRTLVKVPDIICDVESNLYPNKICDYLFETSQKFNQFYENCSVNNAETDALKQSRLTLCTATAGTIRLLLTLLGIQVVEKL